MDVRCNGCGRTADARMFVIRTYEDRRGMTTGVLWGCRQCDAPPMATGTAKRVRQRELDLRSSK